MARNITAPRRVWRRMAAELALAGLLPLAASAQVVDSGKNEFTFQVKARGLKNPEGIALHPANREIYVAERGANRIVALRGGNPAPVIESGWTVETNYPKWVINKSRPREAVERGQRLGEHVRRTFNPRVVTARLMAALRLPTGR